eukprot:8524253-Alexandrium_andersonii.AAC.1
MFYFRRFWRLWAHKAASITKLCAGFVPHRGFRVIAVFHLANACAVQMCACACSRTGARSTRTHLDMPTAEWS